MEFIEDAVPYPNELDNEILTMTADIRPPRPDVPLLANLFDDHYVEVDVEFFRRKK